MPDHAALTTAFAAIEDKNALAWAILEHKSEEAVRRAIALSANRIAGRRVCTVELKRVDIVLHEHAGDLRMYEFKAAYLSDYEQRRMEEADRWLGGNLNIDLAAAGVKRDAAQEACRTCFALTEPVRATSAAVWLLYDVREPAQIIKYPRQRSLVSIAEAKAFIRRQVGGVLDVHASIECGEAWGNTAVTQVAIHMFVFSPLATGRGEP